MITGPSGVGKGTLIRALLERCPASSSPFPPPRARRARARRTGATTTSSRREEFQRGSSAGEFLEHAEYAGNRYGTLRSELDRSRGRAALVLEIELQGARQVREALPEAIQVFIAPPSCEALRARLVGRGADTPEEIERRLEVAGASSRPRRS